MNWQPKERPAATLPNSEEIPPLPSLFLLPGLGGNQKLFQDLPQVVPVSYLDWTDLIQPGVDMSTLFTRVRSQIEARLPSGPVHMAGYSIGGPLAYACARAFQASGRQVLSVSILDATAGDAPIALPLRSRIRRRIERLSSFDILAGLASALAKVLIRPPAAPLLRSLQPHRNRPLPFGFDQQIHLKLTMQLLMPMFWPWWLALTEPASPLTAPTYVFRSQEHESFEPEDLGWGHYCSNVRVIHVPGTHLGMLEPKYNARLCAELLKLAGIEPRSVDESVGI
jgi:phthiocerol/phenolphthiocerol synthesis type-I polyketide synthase D